MYIYGDIFVLFSAIQRQDGFLFHLSAAEIYFAEIFCNILIVEPFYRQKFISILNCPANGDILLIALIIIVV